MLPACLRFRLGSDGNLSAARTEPIAADARPGKDGKNNAKLKLISGLLGVGYDALRRPEQQAATRACSHFPARQRQAWCSPAASPPTALVQRAARSARPYAPSGGTHLQERPGSRRSL